ncbi:unnamed protein product [Acanthosepion pharaonis]|uniref:Uncharacterized protein n=1 Tax=Acanthosepion pharaonis TaxID=158019 RepID=A0A812DXL1_ACAPH|nr:unnamed protein product [Sepia pharaonis]
MPLNRFKLSVVVTTLKSSLVRTSELASQFFSFELSHSIPIFLSLYLSMSVPPYLCISILSYLSIYLSIYLSQFIQIILYVFILIYLSISSFKFIYISSFAYILFYSILFAKLYHGSVQTFARDHRKAANRQTLPVSFVMPTRDLSWGYKTKTI